MDLSGGLKLENSLSQIDINKHFKIIAGPGAGKTTLLVNNIKEILKSSSKISQYRKIVCITYTNVGTKNILKKIENSNDYIEVNTIHSFLYNHIIKPYLWTLKDKYIFDFKKIRGHDKIKPSRSILDEWRKITKQFYLTNDKNLSKALSNLIWYLETDNSVNIKFKNINGNLVENNKDNKNKYIKLETCIEFKKICWKNGLIDHDDILYLSHEILKKVPRILEILRAKFPYIIIDEFQDTNPIQAEIIKLIGEKESIVGVIGDTCQAIYEFQGTDVSQFTKFKLENMNLYYLVSNYRSSKEIIEFLNYMRGESSLIQNLSEFNTSKPKILIGNHFNNYTKVSKLHTNEEVCILSYKNTLVNSVQYDTEIQDNKELLDYLFFDDSDRGKRILYIITSVEYAKENNFKEAIKNMKKAYKKEDLSDKVILLTIKYYINNYDSFSELTITDFYNNFIYSVNEIKNKVMKGEPKKQYDNITYRKIASVINLNDDTRKFRTIHKAKGEEFENVLVLIDEDKKLNFLINPDMNLEEHRVFYVAFSRAKRGLYISIENINSNMLKKLKENNLLIVEENPQV